MATVAERLSVAEKINARIGELLASRYADERRLVLILVYLNLSLSHHQGIICLMVNRPYGPALALVRVTFEATIKAHRIAKFASDAQVDDVAEHDNAKFPEMHEMAEAVDNAFSDPHDAPLDFFKQAKRDAWKATNSYTHSGFRQLARQFSGDRIEATPEEDLISGLSASTASVLLLGYSSERRCLLQSASTACWRIRWRCGRRRSASGSRLERAAGVCSGWCFGRA